MAEQLSLEQIEQLIREQYPTLLAILDKAGVRDALYEAIRGGWNPAGDRFKVRLQQTDWYKTTPAAQRDWQIGSVTDPATYKQRMGEVQQRINNLANSTGITLPPDALLDITERAAAEQWSDAQLRNYYVYAARGVHTGRPTGESAEDYNNVKSLAAAYGVPISDDTAFMWADRLTAGSVSQEAVQGYMIEQAKSLYPGLADAIDSGLTVRQYVDPYAQIAARELNINPNDFDLSDTKWSAPLQQIDPKTGQRTAMSLDAWQMAVRTDPKYGYDQTNNAKAQAATLAETLQEKFGYAA